MRKISIALIILSIFIALCLGTYKYYRMEGLSPDEVTANIDKMHVEEILRDQKKEVVYLDAVNKTNIAIETKQPISYIPEQM